jgi:L-ascorbate metabolism protein UlaG (beta-lactamase superfamily)
MTLRPAEKDGRKFLNPVPSSLGSASAMLKTLPKFFLGATERSPKTAPGPFRTDARIYTTPPQSGLRVTWFGHSSLLVEIDGVRVLIDPVWDERAAPTTWAGPKRFFPPTLALRDLPAIDAVIISHDHFDHLGAQTIRQLAQTENSRRARWITPLGVGAILSSMGVDRSQCTELNWMDDVTVGPLIVTALPARHFSGRSLFNRFQTLWASFALIGPSHRVYYGADSGEWAGFEEIGRKYGPFDLTMLEIGAYDPAWANIHMGPGGAVRSFRALGSRGLLMPIHWGLFDLALHPWTQPIEEISAVEGLKLWSPPPGVPTEVAAEQELRSQWWRGQ